ncbi:cytochrome P450 [Actinosynnema sp. NPDC047251]|uniref:Cytochrome P450 family protein n=1 Tax=Saccharothrix espanaensis (strain ATCC 51144 / DSM 44229 / JCM 9112 / NBRC 15066 / NRRL 15764) TaxID=1179773 RepID=K0K7Y4_SACES|nr:cytochrome P450 [Saccharothrix espanaensis]CCH32773.1 Cytochrome P450 family protein [Saccharothrix espanaensis DSM 44229]
METDSPERDRAVRQGAAELAAALFTVPEVQAGPYPTYRRLHGFGPAVTGPGGELVITGYRLVEAAARDPRLTKQVGGMLVRAGYADWRERPSLRLFFTSLGHLNPPEHTRLRRVVSRAFNGRRVAALRPAVERLVAEALDRLSGGCCFVDEFAYPVPVTVIGELLGIPGPDRPMFQTLVRDWTGVVNALDPATVRRADAAAVVIRDYLDDLAAQRRAHPRDDLLSALVAPAGDEPGLSGEEVTTMAALLWAAGFETTTGLLSNGLVALLDHPDQADRLRAEDGLAGPAVEELLRFDPPLQFLFARTAAEDVVLDGQPIEAGRRTVLVLGAANRDPEVFDEPDRLRLDRSGQPPLSFGGGIHYCLGAALARLEAQVAFPALLRAFPRLEVTGPGERRPGLALHGYVRLPIAT